MRRMTAVLGAGLLAAGLAGCGGNGDEETQAGVGEETISVVAGFYPLYEATRRVGGPRVSVRNVTPAGTDPHDLEITPREVDLIEDAEVVFYFGHDFQPAVETVARRGRGQAVDLLDGLPLMEGEGHTHGHDDDHGHDDEAHDDEAHDDEAHDDEAHDEEAHGHDDETEIDPHVWLDLSLMGMLVERIEETLIAVDPDGRAGYEARGAAYRQELRALDARYQSTLQRCERTTLVVSHAAFGYLGRRYGLHQEAITGLSPELEPDPRRMAELIDLVRDTGTTTVFYETLVSPRIAQTLAREAGVGTAVLNPLEGLTEDENRAGATFVSVMEDNLAALVEGLGCEE